MKTNFETLKNNKLVINSAIFFLGSMAVNVLNYLYHLIMGRMLGPTDYGILVSLISIITIISISGSALSLAITKFSAGYKAENNLGKNKYLFLRASKLVFFVGILLFIVFLFFSKFISIFLKIDSVYLIILTGSFFILAFLPNISKGVVAGWQRFKALSVINFFETLIKLLSGIFLVLLGWKVFGAISAFIISIICGYLFSLISIKNILSVNKEKVENLRRQGFFFVLPALFLSFSIILFQTADIILAKHFLNSYEAGLYSALSTIGRIIFFASGAISFVIFPMVAEKYAAGKKTEKYLLQGALIILIISLSALIFYFLVPNFITLLLYGKKYSAISSLIGVSGIAMTFLSLNNLIGYYYLSLEKINFLAVFGVLNVAQIILILLFHQSLTHIIYVQLFVMIILFLGLIGYHFKNFLIKYDSGKNINYHPGV